MQDATQVGPLRKTINADCFPIATSAHCMSLLKVEATLHLYFQHNNSEYDCLGSIRKV